MKNLIQKLKTGFIGLGLIGASYFNPVKSQENYQPKYNTTTHYIIKEIQKEDAYINLKTLDKIINESKTIVAKKNYTEKEAKDLMEKINSRIIEKYPKLDDEKQSCYYKSLTYLAIGEANNLPLYGVIVPSHMFIRWDSDGKHNPMGIALNSKFIDPEDYSVNAGDFNWDKNSFKNKTDQDYLFEGYLECGKEPFGYGEIRNGTYLKNLNKNELLSVAYQQESTELFDKKVYDLALEYINKSLELNSNNYLAYCTKGDGLYQRGMEESKEESDSITLNSIYNKYFKEAYECYKKSLDFTDISKTKSLIYFKLGKIGTNYLKKYEEAEDYLTKAINDGKFFFNSTLLKECISKRAQLYRLTGQKEKEENDHEEIKKIHGELTRGYRERTPKEKWWEVYPEGVTEEIIFKEKNKKIIQRVVINNKKVDVYHKIILHWTTNYKKNGEYIHENAWEIESKPK